MKPIELAEVRRLPKSRFSPSRVRLEFSNICSLPCSASVLGEFTSTNSDITKH